MLLFLLVIVPFAHGHGGILQPSARNPVVSLWFNEGCQVGCARCKGHVKHVLPWSYCLRRSMQPTLSDPTLITYPNMSGSQGLFRNYNPWLAPGFAPLFSPCGLAAGQANGSFAQNGDVPPPGFSPGFDMRKIIPSTRTEWRIGTLQEVSWSIAANHGGGYAVRLCPQSGDLTESCFQQHHLPFEGDYSWIQFGNNPSNRTRILANRTTSGTNPSGSQWTKVPIPSCGGLYGGGLGCDAGCASPQFPSPISGLWGNGPSNGCAGCDAAASPHDQDICKKTMDYQIVDTVRVPKLPPGDYVLSFRWDCEQTPQIWSQCADIKITEASLELV